MGEVDEQHELCCVCLERLPSAPVVALLTADRAPRSGTRSAAAVKYDRARSRATARTCDAVDGSSLESFKDL